MYLTLHSCLYMSSESRALAERGKSESCSSLIHSRLGLDLIALKELQLLRKSNARKLLQSDRETECRFVFAVRPSCMNAILLSFAWTVEVLPKSKANLFTRDDGHPPLPSADQCAVLPLHFGSDSDWNGPWNIGTASRHVTWDFRSAKIPLRSYHGRNSAAVETDCTDWFISRCCQHDRIQLPFKFDMPKTRQGHCIVIPSHFHGLLSPLLVS